MLNAAGCSGFSPTVPCRPLSSLYQTSTKDTHSALRRSNGRPSRVQGSTRQHDSMTALHTTVHDSSADHTTVLAWSSSRSMMVGSVPTNGRAITRADDGVWGVRGCASYGGRGTNMCTSTCSCRCDPMTFPPPGPSDRRLVHFLPTMYQGGVLRTTAPTGPSVCLLSPVGQAYQDIYEKAVNTPIPYSYCLNIQASSSSYHFYDPCNSALSLYYKKTCNTMENTSLLLL